MSLKDDLTSLIQAGGPLPVSAYMNACLHDPKAGYYATRPGIGRDFVTAPEISQIFGELLGLWSLHEWQAMGEPRPVRLVEVGGGRGTMMTDMLRAIGKAGPGEVFSLAMNEASPIHAARQSEALSHFHPDFLGEFQTLGDAPFILIANEWLDCLPARQFVKSGEAWHEKVVGLDEDGGLAFGLAADDAGDAPQAPGRGAVEVQPALETLVDMLRNAFDKVPGRALFIDYGPDDAAPGDTLRAFHRGEQVDPLAMPGESDLTVDVDFGRLKRLAEAAGLHVHGPVEQGPFLLSLGAEARMQALIKANPAQAEALHEGVVRLVDPEQMGARFKVICLSSPNLPAPAGL
ncbi:class I SAM-dependent methyltransferase [Henriciella aquimarina]|uniref:class I SAM-dependent methyltransferase n=1 Tax=Henriciella aquimarina TaxID=545261 RepID=UPI001F27A36D|nr:SAM-dependent methyltransferase [Henriciella aquimarina]